MLKRGGFSRSRSLEQFNAHWDEHALEKAIEAALKRNSPVRVLEIGCGEGRVLMELRKKFPDIELHGINKKPWRAMKDEKSLMRTGTFYKIFSRESVKKIQLPKIHFYNAEKLHFEENYFDIVYSQVAIHYIKRKDILFEEIWRVLKPEGEALLHIDSSAKEPKPDFMNTDIPRFIIYKGNEKISTQKYFAQLNSSGHVLALTTHDGYTKLHMTKNSDKPLVFGLQLDEHSSFDLSLLNAGKEKWEDNFWGYRSVFRRS
jgi:ubiquinone/menaquinone biosynthesis C-methylase UbiE